MDPLWQLRRRLQEVNGRLLTHPLPAGKGIDQEIAKLRRRLHEGASFVPINRQEEAVRRFWAHPALNSFKDTYLVAFGLTLPLDSQRKRIIEHRDRFALVIAAVNKFLAEPLQYRRCYQGLLHCYFEYDPQAEATPPAGADNWKSLRNYLTRYPDRLLFGAHNPGWTLALQQHPNLLDDSPCARYGLALLAGNRQEIETLRATLRITDASWFTRELYLGQVQAAVAQPDEEFLRLIPTVLEALPEHAGILDRGLATLLDRLVRIQNPPLVPVLRNAAVERWGNPWLQANAPSWGKVSPPARELVTEWLKLEFIQAFFELLSKDGTGNPRRLRFWKKYVNVIDDIHFALGAQARGDRRSDFQKLLKRMEGRRVTLNHRSNNAFVMRMGPLVVVEFSEHSNASYFYRSNAVPFSLDPRKPVQIGVDDPNSLKSSQHELKFSHHDGAEQWETKLARTLAGYGIHPKERPVRHAPALSPQAVPHAPTNIAQRPRDAARWTNRAYSPAALREVCMHYRLPAPDDRTDRGGNMRVMTDDRDLQVNEVLLNWGFRYKGDKQFWWRS